MSNIIDPNLKQWATPIQAHFIDAVNEHGGYRPASRVVKRDAAYIQKTISSLKKRAASQGYSPDHDMTHVVPSPFVVKGISTYYDKDGKPTGQWVKSERDRELAEAAVRAAIEEMMVEVPRAKPTKAPTIALGHLANLYTLTDCHVGMKAWAPETGADWDLEIAESTLVGALLHLIETSPPASVAFLNNLGDFLHQDGMSPVTPTSGHLLDADSRYEKVVKVAVRILRTCIDALLQRHKRVVVLMAEGNHDLASSVWLRHLFALLYEKEPRVEVIESPVPYYAYQHGDTMLAFHHGHLTKNDQLPLLFAAQFSKIWGQTSRRYCHTGHRHHVEEKEHNGMTVTQHPTIAARDAYAARGGWVADRQMTSITYHKSYGQVMKTTVVPEMLKTQ